MRDTISGQLTKLGFEEKLSEFEPLIKYFRDSGGGGCFDTYWSNSIIDVKKFRDGYTVLIEHHEWCSGGGVGMSSRVAVISGEKLAWSESLDFRDQFNPKKDRWDLYFTKIAAAKKGKSCFVVTLCNNNDNKTILFIT